MSEADNVSLLPEDSDSDEDGGDTFGTPEGEFACRLSAASAPDDDCVYGWVGELLAKVPELQAANARWRHEVHTVQAQLDDARTLHSRQMAECEQQAAAAIESEREVLEREREQWKQYHQRHIEVEREERQRLEARVKMLEAQNARVQEQNAQLEKACASVRDAKTRQLAQAAAEIEDLKAQVSAERAAVGEVRRQQQQQQREHVKAIERERKEAERLGAEAVAHKALASSLQELQARCARTTSRCLRGNDPERLYQRPPMLDMLDTDSVSSLPPGAHGLWQAWWTCPASGNPSAETFEWHMAQVVARYFGSNFLVSLTGGSHDGGVDVWVARRGAAGQAPHAPSQPSSAGAQASPDLATMVYECAVQVKRYQAPLSDASVREFADKFALRAKRGIFIAPGGFGLSAQRFAASKGSWLGEDKVHWLQLWDALALKKLMAQFGDDWCKSVLAARPSSRPWPLPPAPLFNPQVPSSPPGGSSSTARAGAEPAAAPSGLPPGTQGEAGTEGASSLLRVGACAAASGDERSADQARGHVEAGAGAEAEVPGQLLCRIPGCNCARPKGRRAAAVQSVLVPAPAGGSSPLAAAGVGQAGDVSAATSCRTPLKAQPGRLNAGVAQNGVAHCAVLGSEDRSSKRFKFDEEEELEIYCFLVSEMRGAELPSAITSSKVLQGLIDKFPGSLSAQRARSERSLRSRVNGFMLGDSGHAQARRRQLEQDHLRRGQLILHNMG